MRESTPTLKNRKKSVYVFLGLYLFLGLFIIVESALPGDISAKQSNWLSGVWATIVNTFKTTKQGELVYPTSLSLTKDYSFLGEKEVALGTTSLLTYEVKYPSSISSSDTLDPTFSVTREDGSQAGQDYNLVISTSTPRDTGMTGSIRIVGLKEGDYSFSVSLDEKTSLKSLYSFSIVPLAAPASTQFLLKEDGATLGDEGVSFSLGESAQLEAYLTDDSSKASSYSTLDGKAKYMARYLDTSLLAGSNLDGCEIFANGVITASKVGDYSMHYGGQEVKVHVGSGSSPTSDDSLKVETVTGEAYRDSLNIMDYDYPSESADPSTDNHLLNNPEYGMTFKASYSSSPSDPRVHWNLLDPDTGFDDMENPLLKIRARIVSSWYDKEEKASYCYVQGYRKEGKISVKATSNSFPSISASSSSYLVTGATAENMVVVGIPEGKLSKSLGDSANVSATFFPLNTANSSITASGYDETILKVSGNGTSNLIIGTLKVGESPITITSVSNPSLSYTATIEVTARKYYNDTNITGLYTRIRKGIGHFGLFFLTGIVAFIFFHLFFDDPLKDYRSGLASLASGFSLAFLSEAIQGPVAGRTGLGDSVQGVVDIFIDGLGFSLGVLILALICLLVYYVKKRKAVPKKPIKD